LISNNVLVLWLFDSNLVATPILDKNIKPKNLFYIAAYYFRWGRFKNWTKMYCSKNKSMLTF